MKSTTIGTIGQMHQIIVIILITIVGIHQNIIKPATLHRIIGIGQIQQITVIMHQE